MSDRLKFNAFGPNPLEAVGDSGIQPSIATTSDADAERLALEALGRVLTRTTSGRSAVAGAMLSAMSHIQPQLRPSNPDPNGPPTGGGGRPSPVPPPPAPPPNGSRVDVFWWGFRFVFVEADVKWLVADLGAVASYESFIASLVAEVPPVAVFVGAVAAYLAIEASLIPAIDQGRGIYLSMTWLAPGIFVPTAI